MLAALALASAQDALYAWESPPDPYYAAVPGDASDCCGSQLIGDPAYNIDSQICECDATAGVCDAACCCDQDCSEYETMTVFKCSNNATFAARAGVKMCSEELVQTNLPQSAAARGWDTVTDLDGILCVVHDNSASFGAFLTDPTSSSGALSEEEVDTELSRYGVGAYADCVVCSKADCVAGSKPYCEEGASGISYTDSQVRARTPRPRSPS